MKLLRTIVAAFCASGTLAMGAIVIPERREPECGEEIVESKDDASCQTHGAPARFPVDTFSHCPFVLAESARCPNTIPEDTRKIEIQACGKDPGPLPECDSGETLIHAESFRGEVCRTETSGQGRGERQSVKIHNNGKRVYCKRDTKPGHCRLEGPNERREPCAALKPTYAPCRYAVGDRTCRIFKNTFQLEAWLLSAKSEMGGKSTRMALSVKKAIAAEERPKAESLACYIKRYSRGRGEAETLRALAKAYRELFHEELTYPDDCSSSAESATFSPSACVAVTGSAPNVSSSNGCIAYRDYLEARKWFETTLEEAAILVNDVVARAKPTARAGIEEVRGMLCQAVNAAPADAPIACDIPRLGGLAVDRCSEAGCGADHTKLAADEYCRRQENMVAAKRYSYADAGAPQKVYKFNGEVFVAKVGAHTFTRIECVSK